MGRDKVTPFDARKWQIKLDPKEMLFTAHECRSTGNRRGAYDAFETAKRLWASIANDSEVLSCLGNQAILLQMQGRLDEALAHQQRGTAQSEAKQ